MRDRQGRLARPTAASLPPRRRSRSRSRRPIDDAVPQRRVPCAHPQRAWSLP